ncbi:hypothetical protein T492DRAFT_1102039 [Pavlovales sp. CCMP2436]|nr:hypothetical protein T492DRAFT_1102039 [Pavlovales sp. CCMP2436]|mmetsp:Transcript_37235/g.92264  ORF Transcript_37235/g.92264 Transcript_37235/m.92264 type:complete len:378 (-) Transcript_37235:131-1264(-)
MAAHAPEGAVPCGPTAAGAPDAVPRVAWSNQEHIALLARPVVFTGALQGWASARWTPETLAREFGDAPVRARFHSRETSAAEFETEGLELDLSMLEFCDWLRGRATLPALAQLPETECTGYISYHYFPGTFGSDQRALGAVQWRAIGLDIASEESTFWLGSQGARTPCHQDTYGANCVAQLFGCKRWVLFPPAASAALRATRVPYEESSVFSGASPAELAAVPGRMQVELRAGELLVVPKHWWHAVETLSDSSISVNAWVPLPDDAHDRAREALVRLVACSLLSSATAAGYVDAPADPLAPSPPCPEWLNPGEEVFSASEALSALAHALDEDARGGGGSPGEPEARSIKPVIIADVVDALCTGPALDAALIMLHRRL